MPDIKQVLNDEIRRLARKEIKASVFPLIKQISEQKRTIAELKKTIADIVKKAPITVEDNTAEDVVPQENKALRLSAAGIVKIRTKLGLSQIKFAKLLGVSGHTVSLWEIGKVSPRSKAKAAICELRKTGKKDLKKRLAEIDAVNGSEEK